MKRIHDVWLLSLLMGGWTAAVQAADPSDGVFDLERLDVRITESLSHLTVEHAGESVLLMRHQDPGHTIQPPYGLTSRACPPFCIQPMQLAPGVETIGELELIGFLRRAGDGDQGVLVIDSRSAEEVARGTIPGSVNIPYSSLDPAYASAEQIAELLQLEFGAARGDGIWNFDGVKTLVFFCNGPWCGQSPTNIKALTGMGYPAHRLKWYRGGLQAWESLGLTTVRAGANAAQ
ncbi:rhodanese-like domain-containing protein [Thiohalocapsa marina]|uniref:Rhodanese-like domain-containing protein n=1 Tax=Thiohalocapsa marina TaxID=424902 RepID=A0A5M8FHI2_9GAMM|nr:rhodanese-like domain-containing protein [Thiohalocapsa marina]KAA6184169.1 rhodanese-like domain-containing protein [Thiohalocapsa marina]